MYPDAPQACPSAYVVDGDTLRCGDLRLRLLGIDAPELPGHCAHYRDCAPGNGWAAKRSLGEALRNGRLTYSIVTTDRYGRAVVMACVGYSSGTAVEIGEFALEGRGVRHERHR